MGNLYKYHVSCWLILFYAIIHWLNQFLLIQCNYGEPQDIKDSGIKINSLDMWYNVWAIYEALWWLTRSHYGEGVTACSIAGGDITLVHTVVLCAYVTDCQAQVIMWKGERCTVGNQSVITIPQNLIRPRFGNSKDVNHQSYRGTRCSI